MPLRSSSRSPAARSSCAMSVAVGQRAAPGRLDQRLGAPGVVAQRAGPAQELEAHVAAHLLPAHDLDRADLAGAARVRAAAGRGVPVGHLDDADAPGHGRRLAQPEALHALGVLPVEQRPGGPPTGRGWPPPPRARPAASRPRPAPSRSRCAPPPASRRASARRPRARTPRTGRAGRCAAACGRSAAPSPPRPRPRPRGTARPRAGARRGRPRPPARPPPRAPPSVPRSPSCPPPSG